MTIWTISRRMKIIHCLVIISRKFYSTTFTTLGKLLSESKKKLQLLVIEWANRVNFRHNSNTFFVQKKSEEIFSCIFCSFTRRRWIFPPNKHSLTKFSREGKTFCYSLSLLFALGTLWVRNERHSESQEKPENFHFLSCNLHETFSYFSNEWKAQFQRSRRKPLAMMWKFKEL